MFCLTGSRAQAVSSLPQLLQQAGFPEVVTASGGKGNIRIMFNMYTSTSLNNLSIGAVTNRTSTSLNGLRTRPSPIARRRV